MPVNSISIIISAPSGCGKTTIINKLLSGSDRFEFSISTTTREPRVGEIDGKNYYFITVDQFQSIIKGNEFIEWAEVYGNYYGTTKKEIDRIVAAGKIPIFDIDVQGTRLLKDKIENGVFIFIIPPSKKVLEQRLRNRKTDSEKQIQIRLNNAIKELEEFDLYDYIVINDNLDIAVEQVNSIITAELCRKNRLAFMITNMLEV